MGDFSTLMNAQSETKVVVVTGASGGLGRALSAAFVRDGWQVVAGSRSAILPPPHIAPLPLDVARAEDVEGAFTDVLQRYGRIDALINNAGVTRDSALAQMSDEDWDDVLDINLRAA